MRKKIISKEELLLKAIDIIREEDLEACSIRRLAGEAGIAVGTVYNYFSSHQVLLGEVFQKSWQNTLEKVERIDLVQSETPREAFSQFYQILLEDMRNRKGIGKKIIHREGSPFMGIGKAAPFLLRLTDWLDCLLAMVPKYGEFSDEKRKRHSRWLLRLTTDSIMMSLREGGESSAEELVQLFSLD